MLSGSNALRVIDLSYNNITLINGKLIESNVIEKINLNANAITNFSVNTVFSMSSNDLSIWLNKNPLNAIHFDEIEATDEHSRVMIHLDQNIDCNCNTSELVKFMKMDATSLLRQKLIIRPELIFCDGQKRLENMNWEDLNCSQQQLEPDNNNKDSSAPDNSKNLTTSNYIVITTVMAISTCSIILYVILQVKLFLQEQVRPINMPDIVMAHNNNNNNNFEMRSINPANNAE